MTNKFLASSYSLLQFLPRLPASDEYIFSCVQDVLTCCGLELDIKTEEEFEFELTGVEMDRLKKFLSFIMDQPILIVIDDDGHFWIKEFMI